ncbi:gamma-glutamylcyclotransferase [Paracoccus sp. MBLB3053]|uniref:glutathione-specific gamma-glutamylcyclotransferase n=1 Tax=Paracoccus aurantius TaxID=3073814 RepID=A0ABU2HRU1_9RHOB|nr:gamma-glutamylcyclotransferase [Paracoccus sp. MBLB3053]MDS9467746.1 gamma-glutamylcyclotransferase [Paracoccus sp. MBLB3053]
MHEVESDGVRVLRQMVLTPDHVALTLRPEPDHGPEPGWTLLSDDEIDQLAQRLAKESGDGPLWVFAYGSLIWKPDFDAIGHLRASAYGWHRSFCLRMNRWRGSPQQFGLMMALERGGRCDGVVYRVRDDDRLDQIRRMVRREIRFRDNIGMVRWIRVHTTQGRMPALVFWAGPTGERILSRLPLDEVAHVLARACGPAGSCAEYLFNTVLHLKEFGIHDRNLWRLQELVAREIEDLHFPLSGEAAE